jgi:hypothetical protein
MQIPGSYLDIAVGSGFVAATLGPLTSAETIVEWGAASAECSLINDYASAMPKIRTMAQGFRQTVAAEGGGHVCMLNTLVLANTELSCWGSNTHHQAASTAARSTDDHPPTGRVPDLSLGDAPSSRSAATGAALWSRPGSSTAGETTETACSES